MPRLGQRPASSINYRMGRKADMVWGKRLIKKSGPLPAPTVRQTTGAVACPYGRKKCCSRMSASVIVQSELSCQMAGKGGTLDGSVESGCTYLR